MTNPLPRRRSLLHRRWTIGCAALIALAILVGWLISMWNRSQTDSMLPGTVVVTRGNLVSGVTGSGTIAAEQSLNLSFQTGGTVTRVMVTAGDTVSAGQILAQLDDRNLQIQLTNARAGLTSAQARLTQLQQGNARPEDVAAGKASLTSAQAAYDAAVQSAGTTGSQLVAARASMEKSQVALAQAQGAYDQVAWRPDIAMLPQAQTLQNATIDFQQAKANYDALAATARSDASSKLQSAMAQLEQAKTNLAKLTASATETDLAIQKAAVVQAEQSLKQAELNVEGAVLRAPFAGITTMVNILPGSQVAAGTTVATLIDRSTLHVDLRANENDVVRLHTGQPVGLTIDSLSDWQVQGTVTYVAPASEVVNGVVTYAVRVSFPDTDSRVKVGMTTNLNIETARRENVLLVPNSALLPKGVGRVVQLPGADGKEPRQVDVEIGLTDGVQTEIKSGLSEGDRIIGAPQPKRPGGGVIEVR